MSMCATMLLLLLLCLSQCCTYSITAASKDDPTTSLEETRGKNNDDAVRRDDLKFLVEPNLTHWQELLLPAPTVVSLLGQMVVFSSKVDVSIEDGRPRDGWRFVQYPQSLRASLIQISHKAWDSFRVAQDNMYEIQLTMSIVPRHLQSVMKIIKTMPPKMIGILLPKKIALIGDAGTVSSKLVDSTHMAVLEVMELTEEIEAAVIATQGVVDRNLTVNIAQRNATVAYLNRKNVTNELVKQHYKKAELMVEKARKAYEEAVRNIPTGWNAVFMDIARSFTNMVEDVVSLVTLGIGGSRDKGGSGGSDSDNSVQSMTAIVEDNAVLNAAKKLQGELSKLQMVNFESFDNSSANHFAALKSALAFGKQLFEDNQETVIKQRTLSLYEEVIGILTELEKAAHISGPSSMNHEEKSTLKARIDTAVSDGKSLTAAAATNAPRKSYYGGSGNGNADNERFIVNVRQNDLRHAEDKLDEAYQSMIVLNDEMAEVEGQLAALDINRINLQDIRDLLTKVIKILGRICQQWALLVEFFSMIASNTKIINSQMIQPFLSETSSLSEAMTDELRANILDYVLELTDDVNSASYFLHTIAKTYVDVSQQYFLRNLAGLSQLLGAESDEERNLLIQQLQANANTSRDGIRGLIRSLHNTYKQNLQERQRQLIQYEQSLTLMIGSSAGEKDDHVAMKRVVKSLKPLVLFFPIMSVHTKILLVVDLRVNTVTVLQEIRYYRGITVFPVILRHSPIVQHVALLQYWFLVASAMNVWVCMLHR